MNKSNLPPALKTKNSNIKFGSIILDQKQNKIEPMSENVIDELEKAVKEGVFKSEDKTE